MYIHIHPNPDMKKSTASPNSTPSLSPKLGNSNFALFLSVSLPLALSRKAWLSRWCELQARQFEDCKVCKALLRGMVTQDRGVHPFGTCALESCGTCAKPSRCGSSLCFCCFLSRPGCHCLKKNIEIERPQSAMSRGLNSQDSEEKEFRIAACRFVSLAEKQTWLPRVNGRPSHHNCRCRPTLQRVLGN